MQQESLLPTDNELLHPKVRRWIQSGLYLHELFGNYPVGMAAFETYLGPNGDEVTAEYVGLRLNNFMSEDTARRKLNEMVALGTMTVRKEGRTRFYRLTDEIIDDALEYLTGSPEK